MPAIIGNVPGTGFSIANETSPPFEDRPGYQDASRLFDEVLLAGGPQTDRQREFMRLFLEFQQTCLDTATTLSIAAREARYAELMDAADAVIAEARDKRDADVGIGAGMIFAGAFSAGAVAGSSYQTYRYEQNQARATQSLTSATALRASYPNRRAVVNHEASAAQYQALADRHNKAAKAFDVSGAGAKSFSEGASQVRAADINEDSADSRADQSVHNANAQKYESTQTISEQQVQQALQKSDDAIQQKREVAKRENEAINHAVKFA